MSADTDPMEEGTIHRKRIAARSIGAHSRPVVMADVARVAGVSQMTVSRVLNDHPLVAGANREGGEYRVKVVVP